MLYIKRFETIDDELTSGVRMKTPALVFLSSNGQKLYIPYQPYDIRAYYSFYTLHLEWEAWDMTTVPPTDTAPDTTTPVPITTTPIPMSCCGGCAGDGCCGGAQIVDDTTTPMPEETTTVPPADLLNSLNNNNTLTSLLDDNGV